MLSGWSGPLECNDLYSIADLSSNILLKKKTFYVIPEQNILFGLFGSPLPTKCRFSLYFNV